MGRLLHDFSYKTVGGTVPGELFLMSLRNLPALCMNLQTTESGGVQIALLRFAERDVPSYFESEKRFPCLSYGTEWLIEPVIGEETRPENKDAREKPWALLLGADTASICLWPISNRGFSDEIYIDLLSLKRVGYPNDAAPVLNWHIWRSKADRHIDQPLATFPFESQKAPYEARS